MGSIQALRSEALALRAREDTSLQVSSHLGGVNKSLGGQITSMIDQLQGVINERTKAYNGMVTKLNKSINGKGGIGDQGIKSTFQAVNTVIAVASATKGDVGAIIKATAGLAELILGFLGAQESMQSAILDYKKEISQIGFSDVDRAETGFTTSGASGQVIIRDSLMPRYKAHQTGLFTKRGYAGTLRRI
jgi:hypothetical protein